MNRRGLTMVELILALVLAAILFSGTAVLLQEGFRSYVFLSERDLALREARQGLERMVRELRGVGEADFQGIAADRVRFRDSLGTQTDFHWDRPSQTVFRGNDLLIRRVLLMTFTGFADTGAATTTANQVRRLRLQFTYLPAGQTTAVSLETDIFLRNYLYEEFQ